MPQQPFYPGPIADRVTLMEHVRDTIGQYVAPMSLPSDQVAQQAADATLIRIIFDAQQGAIHYAHALTSFVKSALKGDPTVTPVVPTLAPLTWDATLTLIFGIETRFLAFIAALKKNSVYTHDIGTALHVEGAAMPSLDPTTAQPVITVRKVGPNRIRVGWHKYTFGGLKIYVDRGDGAGPQWLATDTVPDYDDTHAWPATPQTWTYTAVYLLDDVEVGQMSAPVSIDVSAA